VKLYNTETRKKEEVTSTNHKLSLYTCGPTVYNFAHIGNFRTYVFEDFLRRTLKFFSFDVTQVMNITDIDDKTIAGAVHKNITLQEFTRPYIDAFFEDLHTLNIEKAEHYPHATTFVSQMIVFIQTLLDKGIAYAGTDGSIYFAIAKCPKYGKLSHFHLKELQAGASKRVALDEYDKENVADFVLWKAYEEKRDGKIFWESPFGKGRPGWHIECSTMAIQLLGETVDIHVGGVDNMFPHHENEIAQSEACTGHPFVRYWLHAEHLVVENKKMAKSAGNFYTLRDLIQKGFTGPQIRFLLLQTHYRTKLNFSFEALHAAAKSLERIADFAVRLRGIEGGGNGQVVSLVQLLKKQFLDALADDLNISVALAALFDFIREVNTLCDGKKVGKEEAENILQMLHELDTVLGCLPLQPAQETFPPDILALLAEREKARTEKNWAIADKCRAELLTRGFLIEDTQAGARLKRRT